MRNKKTIKNTMNSQVYKKALNDNTGCPYCGVGRGCNRNKDYGVKSWKDSRGTQYKE